jgi:hypothetical protein
MFTSFTMGLRACAPLDTRVAGVRVAARGGRSADVHDHARQVPTRAHTDTRPRVRAAAREARARAAYAVTFSLRALAPRKSYVCAPAREARPVAAVEMSAGDLIDDAVRRSTLR